MRSSNPKSLAASADVYRRLELADRDVRLPGVEGRDSVVQHFSRQNSKFVLCSVWNPQPVQTDKHISYMDACSQDGRSAVPPHSGPTGVGASGKPEGRPPAHHSHCVPVRPPTSQEWSTVQHDGFDVVDVARRSTVTPCVVRVRIERSQSM